MNLADKVLQHFFGDLEVGNYTVFQRADSGDVARSTAQHTFRFNTHCFNNLGAVMVTNRHYRRLVQNNTATADINKGISGSQVDRQVVGKCSTQKFHHDKTRP